MTFIRIIAFMILIPTFVTGKISGDEIAIRKNSHNTENIFPGKEYSDVILNRNIYYSINDDANTNLIASESSQSQKQKLDSLVIQSWDTLISQWNPDEKYQYTYDNKGRLTRYILFDKDQTTGLWINSYKEEYSYDNGNLTQYIDYYFDKSTETWIKDDKDEYDYDGNGNMTQYITYDRDETTNQWIPAFKGEFSYYDNKLTQYISYYRDEAAGIWIASYKTDYSYDHNGNVTQYLGYCRDETESKWVNSIKGEYTYDSNELLSLYISYYYNTTSSQWVSERKEEYAYDPGENLTQVSGYYWDGYSRRWLSDWKQEYNYDTYNNMIRYSEFYWNQSGHKWIATYKEEYSYDNAYSYPDLIIPNMYDDETEISFNHMRVSYNTFYWDESLSRWLNNTTGTYYYSNYFPDQDVPAAVDNEFFLDEDSIISESVGSNDTTSNNEPNSWEIITGGEPLHGKISSWDPANGNFKYEPEQDYNGNDEFFYRLCDNKGNCDTARVDLNITGINDAPFVVDSLPDSSITAGQSAAIQISSVPGQLFDDVDYGDQLSIAVCQSDSIPLPDFMIYTNDTLFAYPMLPDTGCYHILVTATDIEGASASATFELCVYSETTDTKYITHDHLRINIYPNPVPDYLYINFPENYKKGVFELFDIRGKKFINEILKNRERINMRAFPHGIYIYHIIIGNQIYTGKLIKE